ncbi:MAG: RnfABCDGE type electron transport complex subunit D [Tenericutes bacterium]|jgi:electron transport complex protein RnfD|nr:RnfABCDGE type electron transport complex subunit D [Mycoplasmatota bacterium]
MSQEMHLTSPNVPSNKNLLIFSASLVILIIASAFLYGVYVFAVALIALISGGLIEFIFAKVRKTEFDISWIVPPLVVTLMVPPTIKLWVVAVATVFGVFFGKAIFGGLGKNIFNPAIVGVLFITISFPSMITAAEWIHPTIDGFAGATPLTMLNGGGDFTYSMSDLLMGNVPGAFGETFRLGIIILGIILILLKVADWRIPLFYLGSVFIFTAIGNKALPDVFPDPFLSLFVGGLLFGAFFIATDPVTAPLQYKGRILYGIGLAFFTVLIRNFATFQEGVIFAIIIMNAIAPLIDDMFNKNDSNDELVEEVVQ